MKMRDRKRRPVADKVSESLYLLRQMNRYFAKHQEPIFRDRRAMKRIARKILKAPKSDVVIWRPTPYVGA